MGPLVRVVCGECLQSLEFESGEGADVGGTACPYCGAAVSLTRALGSDTPTNEGFSPPSLSSDFLNAKTPRAVVRKPFESGQVGRFLIREPLGEGGYGTVFRAYDPHLDREVALKVLKPNRLGEKALERFFREARAAARLDHPNIVGLHDAGRDDGRCWIAYQLVPGRTLSLIRDTDRPSVASSVRIIRDLALALDHAHGRGVFHRDLKPANVLVDDDGRPRLTDFGLARREDVDSDLTKEGTILGTPQYMSPEAAAGRAHEADARSDVYSLGVILYELICGRRPADVPSGAPLWASTRMATPPTPRSVDRAIPPALDRICMKALAFDPNHRFPDARTLAEALDRHLLKRPEPGGDRPSRSRRPLQRNGLAIGMVVAASVLCLSLGMSFRLTTAPAEAVAPLGIVAGLGPDLSLLGSRETPARIRPEQADAHPNGTTPAASTALAAPVDPASAPKIVASRDSSRSKYHWAAGCSFYRRLLSKPGHETFATKEDAEDGKFTACLPCIQSGVEPPHRAAEAARP